MEIEDLASPEKFETEETVEKVRSGDGQEDMAGVGESDGEREASRVSPGEGIWGSAGWSWSTMARGGLFDIVSDESGEALLL